jgi:secreted trypsin-like serine protease
LDLTNVNKLGCTILFVFANNDLCLKGDSGGPLTVETPSGRHALIGVVSFGVTGCAVMPAFPDLYTRVSEYIKWIEVNAI